MGLQPLPQTGRDPGPLRAMCRTSLSTEAPADCMHLRAEALRHYAQVRVQSCPRCADWQKAKIHLLLLLLLVEAMGSLSLTSPLRSRAQPSEGESTASLRWEAPDSPASRQHKSPKSVEREVRADRLTHQIGRPCPTLPRAFTATRSPDAAHRFCRKSSATKDTPTTASAAPTSRTTA